MRTGRLSAQWPCALPARQRSAGRFAEALGCYESASAQDPGSAELHYNAALALQALERKYAGGTVTKLDGVSVEFDDWHFNVRASNTEPLLRLNVEARGDADLVAEGVARVRDLIEG